MHAVVLVGGFGTRLRPLTNTVPKSMLPIAHVPLIVRHIGQLERGGVDHVTLALGFLPEPFIEAFPDGRCGAVRMAYAIEPEPLDTAGAVRFAADHTGVDDTFVVTNGDNLSDLSVADLVATHRAAGAEATIHLIGVEDPTAFGVVEREPSGRILRFVEKPPRGTEPSNLINAGTYVLEPSVLERIPTGRPVSIERETFPAVAAGGRFHSMATDDYWIDAGRPELYARANLDLVNGRRAEVCPAVAAGADVRRRRRRQQQRRRPATRRIGGRRAGLRIRRAARRPHRPRLRSSRTRSWPARSAASGARSHCGRCRRQDLRW